MVRIFDEISLLGVTAEQFAADLDGVEAAQIEIQINSPGGSVFDGIAIYNTLRNHPASITTRVVGLAASIASVIVQAGDVRILDESAQMMIHRARGVTFGTAADHDEMADVLRQQDDVIAGIYARRGAKPVIAYRRMMGAETWFTAEEAVNEGLADSVQGGSTQASACADRFDCSLTLKLLAL